MLAVPAPCTINANSTLHHFNNNNKKQTKQSLHIFPSALYGRSTLLKLIDGSEPYQPQGSMRCGPPAHTELFRVSPRDSMNWLQGTFIRNGVSLHGDCHVSWDCSCGHTSIFPVSLSISDRSSRRLLVFPLNSLSCFFCSFS